MTQDEITALRALEQKDGTLTPDALIKAAKSRGHPFHKRFPWNVRQAAMQHWRDIARQIISQYTVIIKIEETTRSIPVRAFVHDPRAAEDEACYRSTASIKPNSKDACSVLMTECTRAASLVEKCEGLAEYWQIPNTELLEARKALTAFMARLNRGAKS